MEETKSYLDGLNDVQRGAVTTVEGPVLVIAGPGSGKTRVLTFRIAHLIEEGIKPYNILALTFTNKAAREMKERISQVVGNRATAVWAGTFHSIFARILRTEGDKLGYPSNFTIYDTQDSKSIISAIVKEEGYDPKIYETNGIRTRISSAKSNLISPIAYQQNQQLLQDDRMSKRPYIFKIYAKYAARCKRAGAMDFDDLLYQMFILLHKNPDNVVERYRDKFKYLLVDEFQDTNFLQYSIIRKLVAYPGSKRNICVVGDDAQSIYAFRGATIDNILDFKKNFPALKTFKLEQNYRSTSYIVKAANEVISFNKKQIQKKIFTEKGEGHKIQLVKAVTDNEEGKRIADMILEQKTRYHLKNKDVAILYRTNSQSRVFEEFLRRHNILYKVYGGTSFYDRKEVKDLLGYLRLTTNTRDEEALRRVINFPKRGIGKSTVDKVFALSNKNDISPWEVLKNIGNAGFPNGTMKKLRGFVLLIEGFQKRLAGNDAHVVAKHIAEKSNIIGKLKQDTTVEGINRKENVIGLLDGIKEFVENDEVIDEATIPDKSLTSYLQNIALLTDADSDKENDDRVALMSVHAAKGLEFKSVFVSGLEEQLFPSFMAMQSHDGIDEERRLFYVAITRAEQFLTLSYAGSRYRYGNIKQCTPSRFLVEISEENMETPMVTLGQRRRYEKQSSGVTGYSKPQKPTRKLTKITVPDDFVPSPFREVKAGKKVQHLRFGIGNVLKVEGSRDNPIASVDFEAVGNKRIMVKYAKLRVMEE